MARPRLARHVESLLRFDELEKLLYIKKGLLRNAYICFKEAVSKAYEDEYSLKGDDFVELSFILAALPPSERTTKTPFYALFFIHDSFCKSEWGWESGPLGQNLPIAESEFNKTVMSILDKISKQLFKISTDPGVFNGWKKNYKKILKNTVLAEQLWSS